MTPIKVVSKSRSKRVQVRTQPIAVPTYRNRLSASDWAKIIGFIAALGFLYYLAVRLAS